MFNQTSDTIDNINEVDQYQVLLLPSGKIGDVSHEISVHLDVMLNISLHGISQQRYHFKVSMKRGTKNKKLQFIFLKTSINTEKLMTLKDRAKFLPQNKLCLLLSWNKNLDTDLILKSSSLSSCRTISTNLFDPLPPPLSIVHRFQ